MVCVTVIVTMHAIITHVLCALLHILVIYNSGSNEVTERVTY